MKRGIIITFFVISQLALVCAYIQKESQRINAHYIYQKRTKELSELEKQQRELKQQVYSLQNLEAIDKFARAKLNLKPIALEQIKTLENLEELIKTD